MNPLTPDSNTAVLTPPDTLPLLPVRGVVLFPGTVIPLTVRRPKSLRMIDEGLGENRELALVSQRDEEIENPTPEDLYPIGVVGKVVRLIRKADQSEGIVVFVQIDSRARVVGTVSDEPWFTANMLPFESTSPPADDDYWKAAVRNLRDSSIELIEALPDVPNDAAAAVANLEDAEPLTDFLASNLSLDLPVKQRLLEQPSVLTRVETLQRHIENQLHIAELQKKLRQDVQSEFSDSQRRAYLREQLRAIQRELGEGDGTEEQVEDLRTRLEEANLPETANEVAQRELRRLDIIPAASPEHGVIVTYLETLSELPWNDLSDEILDLGRAKNILDRDHHGLEKIKQRLLETLAVRKLNPEGRSPILCLAGPPGVGKTSLGRSIAEALGREFARISLGGVRDESEIRGHRRTYIGSMPGRLIQELRRLGTRNPVILLDEIDKLGADFRGDPASALLEVLDPQQNNTFTDRYLDVPFDLSQVLFIATANVLSAIPGPLRDRLEIIGLPGYTESEKHNIARDYLVPRQLKEKGLSPEQCRWTDDALRRVIADHTREAGVRELERQIGAVSRGVAARIVGGEAESVEVTPDFVREKLGPERFRREAALSESGVGMVNGLAWTPVGGDVLHIEAMKFPGKGKIKLTGQLGNVMKESVDAALTVVKARAETLGIDPTAFDTTDIHIHVPAGAVPKDGPSAGIAMATALASLFTDSKINCKVGMTGEITLRGRVLPIGGLKEKSLAALAAGITTIVIPEGNRKDLEDLPEEARQRLRILPVSRVEDVWDAAFIPPPVLV